MNNADYIRSLNDEELADYINSIYLTGVMVGKGVDVGSTEVTSKWLQKEHKDVD